MGTRKRAGKQNKAHNNIVRTVWKDTERSVKRNELDTIASICGATRETIGSVISDATLTDEYDDGAAAANERASESTNTGTSTATV